MKSSGVFELSLAVDHELGIIRQDVPLGVLSPGGLANLKGQSKSLTSPIWKIQASLTLQEGSSKRGLSRGQTIPEKVLLS